MTETTYALIVTPNFLIVRILDKSNNTQENSEFTLQTVEELLLKLNSPTTSDIFIEIIGMEDVSFSLVNVLLKQIKSLRELVLDNCNFSEKSFLSLLQILPKEVPLIVTFYDELGSVMVPRPVREWWTAIKSLTHSLKIYPREIKLTIRYGDNFDAKAIQNLALLSMDYGCIKGLNIDCASGERSIYQYLPMFLSGNTILEKLAVFDLEDGVGLNNADSRAFFEALANNNTLKSLSMHHDYWDEQTCHIVEKSLKQNTTLKQLKLINGDECNEVIDILNVIMHSSSLKIIKVSGTVDNSVNKINEIIKNNKQWESVTLCVWGEHISKEINLNKFIIDAVSQNKMLTTFELQDNSGSFNLSKDEKQELASYLERNKNIQNKYLQATEFYNLAVSQSESSNLVATDQTSVNKNYESCLECARECLASGDLKAQLLIDKCLLSYSRFLVRSSKYSEAMACLDSIAPTSEIFKEVPFEKANFILDFESDDESDQDRQTRMRKALAVIPHLYQEHTPGNFKQIFLQLMQLYAKQSLNINSGLTWKQIEELNPVVFFKVALDIEILKAPENKNVLVNAITVIGELMLENKQ